MYLGRATSRNFNLPSGSVEYKFRAIMPETFWLKFRLMCRAEQEVFDVSSPYMFCTWCNSIKKNLTIPNGNVKKVRSVGINAIYSS